MTDRFAYVVDGEIKRMNIRRGASFNGISFGKKSPDATYIANNLWPIIGSQPQIADTERIVGIRYELGDQVVNKVYDVEPIPLEVRLDRKLEELKKIRLEKETAGITVGTDTIDTDKGSQATLTGLYIAMQLDPNTEVEWKTKGGKFKKLKKADADAIIVAVISHVQACFARESELATALEADITTDITTGWPV